MSRAAAADGARPQGGLSARVDLHLGAHPSELPVVGSSPPRVDAARAAISSSCFEFGPSGQIYSVPGHSCNSRTEIPRSPMMFLLHDVFTPPLPLPAPPAPGTDREEK